VIEDSERLTGCEIERAHVDKGYRGHRAANQMENGGVANPPSPRASLLTATPVQGAPWTAASTEIVTRSIFGCRRFS
jgi:hypothetical protein